MSQSMANEMLCTCAFEHATRPDPNQAEIVVQLLAAKADPSVRNDLGMDVLEISRFYGPFPVVEKILSVSGVHGVVTCADDGIARARTKDSILVLNYGRIT